MRLHYICVGVSSTASVQHAAHSDLNGTVMHSQTHDGVSPGVITAGKCPHCPLQLKQPRPSLKFPCWCCHLAKCTCTHSATAHICAYSCRCFLHTAPHAAWAHHGTHQGYADSHPKCVCTAQIASAAKAVPAAWTPRTCRQRARILLSRLPAVLRPLLTPSGAAAAAADCTLGVLAVTGFD